MSSNIGGFLGSANQKLIAARTALQITTIDFYTKGEGQSGRVFSLEVENGKLQKESFDRNFSAGIEDSFDVYDKNSHEHSYSSTFRMEEGTKNPFDRDNWRQTGVSYEEKQDGESVFSVERSEEPTEKEKPWLNTHLDASATMAETSASSEGSVIGATFENEHHKLELDALGYEAGASASVGFGQDGVNAQASANVEAYLLKAEYEGRYGPAYLTAETSLGAELSGNAEVNFNPLQGNANASIGGEAFAGGKFEAETGLEGQYGQVGGNAGVTYGIGAEANADIGLEDGKVKAEFDLGATVGLGVDVGFEVEVDVKETAKDVKEKAKDITGWIPGTPWG